MSINDMTGWSTTAEIAFIEQMASKTEGVGLLRGYLKGMRQRVEFGKIDAAECIQHAQKCLARREKQREILADVGEIEA